MKKLAKLKLNQLNKELSIMEKLNLKGGYGDDGCCCGCHGPSSTWDNQNANVQLTSPGGCHNCNCGCFEWDAEVATNFMHA